MLANRIWHSNLVSIRRKARWQHLTTPYNNINSRKMIALIHPNKNKQILVPSWLKRFLFNMSFCTSDILDSPPLRPAVFKHLQKTVRWNHGMKRSNFNHDQPRGVLSTNSNMRIWTHDSYHPRAIHSINEESEYHWACTLTLNYLIKIMGKSHKVMGIV